ncbi:MAG: hypothetical protein ACC628_26660, partial [Pirellulaceae bacterium]
VWTGRYLAGVGYQYAVTKIRFMRAPWYSTTAQRHLPWSWWTTWLRAIHTSTTRKRMCCIGSLACASCLYRLRLRCAKFSGSNPYETVTIETFEKLTSEFPKQAQLIEQARGRPTDLGQPPDARAESRLVWGYPPPGQPSS